jgi:hypothetical protein
VVNDAIAIDLFDATVGRRLCVALARRNQRSRSAKERSGCARIGPQRSLRRRRTRGYELAKLSSPGGRAAADRLRRNSAAADCVDGDNSLSKRFLIA